MLKWLLYSSIILVKPVIPINWFYQRKGWELKKIISEGRRLIFLWTKINLNSSQETEIKFEVERTKLSTSDGKENFNLDVRYILREQSLP